MAFGVNGHSKVASLPLTVLLYCLVIYNVLVFAFFLLGITSRYLPVKTSSRKLLGKPLSPTDLVFSHPDGTPFRPDSLTRAFHTVTRSLGLDGGRLHDLRHAHATLMLQQGIHPKIVSERLGHSSVAIPLDTYSHVPPGLQETTARRFDEGLQGVSVDVPPTGIR